jgi:hypothetical protein
MFKLRFPKSDIPKWAERYDYAQDGTFMSSIAASVKRRGYLKREEFLAVCKWKTPRSQPRCARNQPDCVARITRVALAPGTPDRLKIQVLTELSGVGWPTASVILHFFDREPFPILDYRALWSVGQGAPSRYTHDFWHEYTRFTRGLATKVGCDMRTLDRALWQYSKDNQG